MINPKPKFTRHPVGSVLIDFAPALLILLILMLPAINLTAYVAAVSTAYFTTVQAVSTASVQTNYYSSLGRARNKGKEILSSGLGQWCKLSFANPMGVDLYVVATDYNTQKVSVFGPNMPVPVPIDPSSKVYEFQAQGVYEVQPFLNLASLPGLGDVPAVGKPAKLRFSANRIIEHPEGLQGPGMLAALFNNGGPPGSSPIGSSGFPPGAGVNYPNLKFYTYTPDPNKPGTGYLSEVSFSKEISVIGGVPYPDFYLTVRGVYVRSSALDTDVDLTDIFETPNATGTQTTITADPGKEVAFSTEWHGGSAGSYSSSDLIQFFRDGANTGDATSDAIITGSVTRMYDWMKTNKM